MAAWLTYIKERLIVFEIPEIYTANISPDITCLWFH